MEANMKSTAKIDNTKKAGKSRTSASKKASATPSQESEEAARFLSACDLIIHSAHSENGIGTLSEKTVHSVLKNYIEPDSSYHEIKTGRYVADIRNTDGIYEIQTRQFNKLRSKLDAFLPEYPVTVVYPIPHSKYLRWINEDTGEISPARKSPKTGVFQSVFYELYKIKPYLTHPNFHLLLLLIDLEEYRFLNGYSKDRKKGSTRSDRIPTALYASKAIMSKADYKQLIPDGLPEAFTSKDYAKACRLSTSNAQLAVNVLSHVGAIEYIGKSGRAYLYRRI